MIIERNIAQDAGFVDEKDNALTVGRNFVKRSQNRVFSEDHIGRDITFNDHGL